jgi:hypothetical protein
VSDHCPVCSSDIPKPHYYDDKGKGMEHYSCQRCGDFHIVIFFGRVISAMLNNDNTRIAALSHWIRTRHDAIVMTLPNEQGFTERIILDEDSVHSIIKKPPPTPAEQADNFVRWIGDKISSGNENIAVNKCSILGIVGSKDESEFYFVTDHLKKEGTIETKSAVGRGHVDLFDVTLSFNGLKYYNEIKRGTSQADGVMDSDLTTVSIPNKAKSVVSSTASKTRKRKRELSKGQSMATSETLWKQPSSKDIWGDIYEDFDVKKLTFAKDINFVTDTFKRKAIFRDLEQAYILAKNGFSKPAVILAGSVIEELLRLYLKAKNVNPPNNTFDVYIQTCEQNGLLKGATSRLSDSVRHFRNLVHLERETSSRGKISKATAKSAVTSVFVISNAFRGGKAN